VRASIAALRDLGDTLLAERADDLLDLESQVLAALAGETGSAAVELPERAIVLADELLPSQLIALDAARIAGIGTARGGATSHVAILAAAMDKPMLVGLGAAILGIEPGTRLWLDAEGGSLQVEPPRARIAAAERELAERAAREAADRASARMPAVTADGVQIAVLATSAPRPRRPRPCRGAPKDADCCARSSCSSTAAVPPTWPPRPANTRRSSTGSRAAPS
jgi:phosphocarrier protein FPr/phosphocarrier protein